MPRCQGTHAEKQRHEGDAAKQSNGAATLLRKHVSLCKAPWPAQPCALRIICSSSCLQFLKSHDHILLGSPD